MIHRPIHPLSRSTGAFSSLAASCGLSVIALLGLTAGLLQDSHADGVSPHSLKVSSGTVEIPVLEPTGTARPREVRSSDLASPAWISRRAALIRGPESPARESFGLSKIAFPLLVGDVAPVSPVGNAVVMSGSTVGVR